MALTPQRSKLEVGPAVVTAQVPGEAAAVYLRFAAGTLDEGPDEQGLAHVVEHMLFKGTVQRGVGAAAHAIEALGGDLNAYTSHDELVLHAVVSAGAWRLALDVLVDLARFPLLDGAELDRERPVILQEISAYGDDADDVLAEATQAALWGDHPLGRPVIGTPASVSQLTQAQVAAFVARHLTPDRATIVVVADATHAEVVAEVDARCAGWALGPGRTPAPIPAPVDTPLLVRPEGAFDDLGVELAWRGPGPGHPDRAALTVLLAILGSAEGDRISQCLDEDPKVGVGGWAELSGTREHGAILVGFRPLPGHTVNALDRVVNLLRHAARSCRGRMCARARETLIADIDFADQTVDGIAEDLLHHELATGGHPERRGAWRDALAAVTPEDVTRVARTWMAPDAAVVSVLDPKASGVSLRRSLKAAPPPPPARSGEVVMRSGTRILVKQEDTPVAAVRLVAPGGALWTPDGMGGIAEAWSRMVHRGAGRYDESTLHDALDDLATELHPVGGRAALGLSASCPAAHTADLLDIFGDLVLDPHFEEEEWAHVREDMQDSVRTRSDHAHEVVEDEAAARRFPGHPWRHPAGGTLASLGRIRGKALARFHQQHMVQGRLAVVVVGGVDTEEVLDALAWLDELPAVKAVPPSPPWPALVPCDTTLRAGSRQAVVALVGDGGALGTPSNHAYDVVEALLDGQAGRLFLDLRERRSLAYDLWARHDPGRSGGLFHLGLGCDPGRVDEAVEALRGALVDLVERPPAAAELDRARALLVGQETLRAQRAEHRAARLAASLLEGADGSVAARRAALEGVDQAVVIDAVQRMLRTGFVTVRSRPRDGA